MRSLAARAETLRLSQHPGLAQAGLEMATAIGAMAVSPAAAQPTQSQSERLITVEKLIDTNYQVMFEKSELIMQREDQLATANMEMESVRNSTMSLAAEKDGPDACAQQGTAYEGGAIPDAGTSETGAIFSYARCAPFAAAEHDGSSGTCPNGYVFPVDASEHGTCGILRMFWSGQWPHSGG